MVTYRKISAIAVVVGIAVVALPPPAAFAHESTNSQAVAATTPGKASAGPDKDATTRIQRVVERAIDRRNHQVIKGNKGPAKADIVQDTSPEAVGTVEQDYTKLRQRRDELATYGVVFAGSSSEVVVKNLIVNGEKATAVVEEKTRLSYEARDSVPSPDQIYIYEQSFDLVKTGMTWKITGTKPARSSPMAPTTVIDPADSALAALGSGSSPSRKDSLHGARVYRDVTGKPAKLPKELQNTKNVGPNGEAKTGANGSPTPTLMMASYNYYNMIVYAATWFNGHNWQYWNYENSGGDCTNFVSQALAAGGWQQVGSGLFWERTDPNKWYHSNPDSYTWSGAQNFYGFAINSGRTYELAYLSQLGPADVLQIDWQGAPWGGIDHTALVTFVNGQDIKVSQHTDGVWNRSIWEIYNRNRYATYYGLRT